MTRLIVWIKEFCRWLAEPKVAWAGVIILTSAFLFALRPGSSEFEVRVTGLTLQACGIGTVVFGIRKTRIFFGRPGIPQLTREWVSRFPRLNRDVVIGTGTGMLATTSMSARGYVWSKVDPSAPIEKQIEALSKNMDRINERINQFENDIYPKLQEHSEALKQEKQVRERNDAHLHERLETAETGGLHISFVGLVWIVFGLVLSTVSVEIVRTIERLTTG